jgi:hypothetical protein
MKGFLASATLAGALLASCAASATTVVDLISGSFNEGIGSFSGEISLDVVGGQAISGSGYINILGLSKAPLVLITSSTPGNEGTPVGFRGNDGTDFFDLNTNWLPDSAGLLFNVGTTTAEWGKYPLYNLASGAGDSAFDGKINGTEYWVATGTTTLTAVPETSTWAMLGLGFAALGFAGYRKARTPRAVSF